MGKDKVGHAELTGGASTVLHSHPGGGGLIIKAGTIVTDANGVESVIFVTPFADVNYAICFGCDGSADDVIATWTNKTVDGFNIRTCDDGGKAESNAIVNWIATPYNNT